jgi:hypothetical protein
VFNLANYFCVIVIYDMKWKFRNMNFVSFFSANAEGTNDLPCVR